MQTDEDVEGRLIGKGNREGLSHRETFYTPGAIPTHQSCGIVFYAFGAVPTHPSGGMLFLYTISPQNFLDESPPADFTTVETLPEGLIDYRIILKLVRGTAPRHVDSSMYRIPI